MAQSLAKKVYQRTHYTSTRNGHKVLKRLRKDEKAMMDAVPTQTIEERLILAGLLGFSADQPEKKSGCECHIIIGPCEIERYIHPNGGGWPCVAARAAASF